jgi:hypothetical protein
LATVSSQVSQVPHGVTPPAQLPSVPPRLGYDSTKLPSRKIRLVVPPAAKPLTPERLGVPIGRVDPAGTT